MNNRHTDFRPALGVIGIVAAVETIVGLAAFAAIFFILARL